MPSHQPDYGRIVERVLRSMSSGPWTASDLERVREVVDDDWCSSHAPNCESSQIVDWLDSLDEDQREDLLFALNSDRDAKQDRWALG